jgi:Peptidase family M49
MPPSHLRLAALALTSLFPCLAAAQADTGASLAELRQMSARFVRTPLVVDTSKLTGGDRKALVKLIEAARIVDELYLDQVWSGNAAEYERLRADHSPLGRARLHYFWVNKEPWSRLDGEKAFLPGVPRRKPLGAAFYPEDMTAADFETWVATLSPKEAEEAKGFYSVIRTGKDCAVPKCYQSVPYGVAYKDDLNRIGALLREAAKLTSNTSLRRFLTTRADAFLSNDYYESDVAWMDLDAPLDITIGPYETYTDEVFGYKAAFEAYVNIRDDRETAKLGFFGKRLQELEDHLPEDPQYRNAKLGALSPISVVNQVISTGDGAHDIATAAYNLPNDDRVVQEKGSKRVMLKNVQEAKFRQILVPIGERVLTAPARKYMNFDWFFTHILAHELMHGLGPHQISVDHRATNPRLELKSLYAPIEEAKADVTGLWALQYMLDHAAAMKLNEVVAVGPESERQLYSTYLASMFRILRFGPTEAHGRGMALQINFLLDHGALHTSAGGEFEIDYARIKDAFRDLDHALLTVEARGDAAGADQLLKSGAIRPEIQAALDRLKDLPTDIEPQLITAEAIAPRAMPVHQ